MDKQLERTSTHGTTVSDYDVEIDSKGNEVK